MLDPDEIEEIDAEAKDEAEESQETEQQEELPENHDIDGKDLEFDVSPPETPQSRKERRQNRFREANERAAALQQQLEAERQEKQQLMQVLQQQRQPPPQQEYRDPHQAEVDAAYREQTLLAQEIQARGNMSPQEVEHYQERVRQAHERYTSALLDQKLSRQQQPQRDPAAVKREVLATQNPDVYGNPRALAYAEAHWKMQVARGASNTDPEVFDQAMDAARREFGMSRRSGARRERTEVDRRRYGASGRGHGAKPGRSTGGSVTITKADKKMADQLYGNIANERERYQKFAREVKAGIEDE